jgi:hypothetical protein
MLGSAYFTDHPTVPRDNIVAEIDVDMIGRGSARDIKGGGPTYLEVVGLRRLSKEFGDWSKPRNAKQSVPFVFNYEYDAPGHPLQYYCRADHYSYARYGIRASHSREARTSTTTWSPTSAVHRLSGLRATGADGVRRNEGGRQRGSSAAAERAEAHESDSRFASNRTRTRRIALATYERAPELAPDDRSLVPALAALGVHAEAVPWSPRRRGLGSL